MNNNKRESIIKNWTYEYHREREDDGTIRVDIRYSSVMVIRSWHYENINSAIFNSYKTTKLLVMAVCGDVERRNT